MASICNDERALFGVVSGHDRKTLSLSAACFCSEQERDAKWVKQANIVLA